MRAEYEKSVFVDEGHIETRRLGPVAFTRPIPAGESAISSLCRDRRGRIFGGTSGSKAHLFFYDPAPDADTVVDVGVLGENMKISALTAHEDGRVFAATAPAEDKKSSFSGSLFCYYPAEFLMDNDAPRMACPQEAIRKIMDTPAEDRVISTISDPVHTVGEIKELGCPVEKEGIASLVMARGGKQLYGLSQITGKFFVYNISTGKVEIKGVVDEVREFSLSLVVAKDGDVYGTCRGGRLFKYNAQDGQIEKLALKIPSLKGRQLYNRVDSWALDEFDGIIYGGTSDGLLFIFNPAEESVVCLGKPVEEPGLRALTVGKDGRVFGIGGAKGGCAHLFCYHPQTRELRDLGMPLASVETRWYGYEFEAAVSGKDGEIYLGESDRISHLFIYYPPVIRHYSSPG